MQRHIWIAAITLFIAAPIAVTAQQTSQSGQTQGQAQSQTKASAAPTQGAPAQASAGQPNSVAEAARKARQDQKSAQKPVVFTNENLPRSSTISIVGATGPAASSASIQAQSAADEKSDERMWRQKFADARYKLQQDRQKLSMLQSEFNALGLVRYFNEHDAVTKQQAIADEQEQINADQKAIDDLEDNLKKAGGDPAWAH